MSPQENNQQALHNLGVIVSQIKNQLKRRDHGAYSTNEAANILFRQLEASNQLDAMGEIVCRLGCRLAIVEESGVGLSSGLGDRPKSVREALYRRQQGDFAERESDWLDRDVALNEGANARRKRRGDCTHAQWAAWIALFRKKGQETLAEAERGQRVLDEHPEWATQPDRTADAILGIDLGPDQAGLSAS